LLSCSGASWRLALNAAGGTVITLAPLGLRREKGSALPGSPCCGPSAEGGGASSAAAPRPRGGLRFADRLFKLLRVMALVVISEARRELSEPRLAIGPQQC